MDDSEQADVTVAFAVMATAVAGHVIVRPAGAVPVRVMLPAKLNVLVRETPTETPVWPTFRLAPVAVMVKSPTWTVAEVEWEAVPGDPAPETLTAYVPAAVDDREQEDVTVAFAVIATAAAGQVIVRPAGAVPVRVMLPAKLNVLVSDTPTETPVWPTLRFAPVALIVKSPT